MPRIFNKLSDMMNGLPIYAHARLKIFPRHHNTRSPLFTGRHATPDISLKDQGSWRLLDVLHEAGFTLIELLIAIAIVSIMATIAVPNILSEMPKFRLNGATQQVVGDLMTARMKAVSQNKSIKVFFINGNQYKICDDTGDNCEKTVDIQQNYKGVTLDTGNDPTFSPRGTATNKTISITNSYGTKTLTVAITGRVKIN